MTAAYAAANPDTALTAAAASVCAMGLCGEIARSRMSAEDGNASYRNTLSMRFSVWTGENLERVQNMKCDKRAMLVYAVTDRAWVGKMSLYEQVEASLQNGATCIQLREKELDDDSFLKEAIDLAALCRRYGVPFIVNDNVEIAIACHADGVHVGQQDMKASDVRKKVGENMIIGVSAHTVEEAVEAVKQGADYLGTGRCIFYVHQDRRRYDVV